MGREFTNVLYAKPLWMYAIDVYSANKTEFLHYQDQHQLCVNDIITLGFCDKYNLSLTAHWWTEESRVNLRDLITQLRSLRNQPMNLFMRQTILDVELACEKIDLNSLADNLQPNSQWRAIFDLYCLDHHFANKNTLITFIKRLNNKKGAEAP